MFFFFFAVTAGAKTISVKEGEIIILHTGVTDIWRFSTAWYGTVRYGTVHFWGVFHWVLYLVPDTFLVPLRSRFHANRTVTKT